METRVRFIAETDGDGNVVCVWHWGPKDRAAHAVGRNFALGAETGGLSFHGASREAITDFLKDRRVRAARGLKS